MISDEAVEAASDLIVQGDMGDCECRRSPFDKHDVNPPCSTRRRAIRIARAALEAAAPYIAAEVLRPVLELHNADGERWVGFPRADRQERYCTECNKAAPCPTVAAITNPYRSQA